MAKSKRRTDGRRLEAARATIVIDPASDTVVMRFAHDGESFDAVQRALDLLDDAERGALTCANHRNEQRHTRAAETKRQIRRAAEYYRQAHDGDEGLLQHLSRRYRLSERTIRRHLRGK